jgi:hypothetical protein
MTNEEDIVKRLREPSATERLPYTGRMGMGAGRRRHTEEPGDAPSVEARYRREHGEAPVILTTREDVEALIGALLTGPSYHKLAQVHSMDRPLLPSGYPDHELLVGVNRDLPVGVLAFTDAESGHVVTLGLSEGHGEVPYLIMGRRRGHRVCLVLAEAKFSLTQDRAAALRSWATRGRQTMAVAPKRPPSAVAGR